MATFISSILILISNVVSADLNGSWQASTAELAGKQFPADVTKTILLVIKDEHYDVGNDHGTIKVLDATKMEITGMEGPNKGKTFKAIYKKKNEELTICYDLSGNAFPVSFSTEPNTKLFLVHYLKVK
jgi:uncharacterized protein (TIGR03067 family)